MEYLGKHYFGMTLIIRLSLTFLLCFSTVLSFAQDEAISAKKLNSKFVDLTEAIYKAHTNELPSHLKNLTSIGILHKKVKTLINDNRHTYAILTIVANMNLLENNIDDPTIPDIVWYLYEKNAKKIAEYLYYYAKSEAEDLSLSRITFQVAKYHFVRGNWQDVLSTLKIIDINSSLNAEEIDYTYLMVGISLQQMRRHRESIRFYDSIEKPSQYHTIALLNKAIAYLRQGWWTDAQIEIEKAIKHEIKNDRDSALDRLYITLGFSQIQFEFYRDARETFRSISLEGPHTNRAILGIGISAMHQGDYIGAINAFNILIEKELDEPSVHESYLLSPFVFEKLKQTKVASAKYTEAIIYFQQKSSEIAKLSAALNAKNIYQYIDTQTAVKLKDTQLDSTSASTIPTLSTEASINLQRILDLKKIVSDTKLLKSLETLQSQYIQYAIDDIKNKFKSKQNIYDSYLSQSRYGLAKLYDKNNKS